MGPWGHYTGRYGCISSATCSNQWQREKRHLDHNDKTKPNTRNTEMQIGGPWQGPRWKAKSKVAYVHCSKAEL